MRKTHKSKAQISKSTFLQLYLLEVKERNQDLAEVFELDHGKTRRMPFEFVSNTRDNDIIPFREALINIERYKIILHTQMEVSLTRFLGTGKNYVRMRNVRYILLRQN